MYIIYKYEWIKNKNRLGNDTEIVLPTSTGKFMCFFDTKHGIDMRLLQKNPGVQEYADPDSQEYALVSSSSIPFYGLGQLRKTLLRAVFLASMRRFFLGRCTQRNHVVGDLIQSYTWSTYSSQYATLH